MKTTEAVVMHDIPNATLPERTDLQGLHIQTDFTDHRGRLVSGKFVSAKTLPDGSIGIKVERYLDGEWVLDGARVSAGEVMPGHHFTSTVHGPESVLAPEVTEAAA